MRVTEVDSLHSTTGVVTCLLRIQHGILRISVIEATLRVEMRPAHHGVDRLGIVSFRDAGGKVNVVAMSRVKPHSEGANAATHRDFVTLSVYHPVHNPARDSLNQVVTVR